MATLNEQVVFLVGANFVTLAVAITPILAMGVMMRIIRWIGFMRLSKDDD